MIFNLFQRPERAHLEMYNFQREIAHRLGLKVTIFVRANTLNDPELMELCRRDHEQYGDEVGLWLVGDGKNGSGFIWLNTTEDKERCVRSSIEAFSRCFGYPPTVVGAYVLDADLIRIIKECSPGVTACVAGCFEEGVKVFHGCNNSWYLFSEGMPWAPWYPSKGHSVRPAANEEDWSGVVAVPHLCRDLVFAYESRNDFFASHPANIQRGLANDGAIHEYDFNLCDQYRLQEDYNDGFSYYQVHVSSGWLSHNFNIIDPDEITQQLYVETLEYIKSLCDEGKAVSLTFSEFAEQYKQCVPIGKQTVALAKDILMGSGKQYYWVCGTDYRALVDTFQGGSIGDLRPYAGRYDAITGPDAPSGRYLMNTYPYLIQSQYRSGYKHHCFDGSRTTLFATHAGEQLDLCAYNTRVESVTRTENSSELTLAPVTLEFEDGLTVTLQTVYRFLPDGKIGITRRILSMSDPAADLMFCEYVKGCYGFTEYPEDMKGIRLCADGEPVIDYCYKRQARVTEGGRRVAAVIPEITTEFSLEADTPANATEIAEGELFDPYYVMKLYYTVTDKTKEVNSWLQIKKTAASSTVVRSASTR